MDAPKRGGVWQRLRRLDERSGATDYVHSRAEFFAPGYVLGVVVLVILGVAGAVQGDGPLVLFAVFGLLMVGPYAYVGVRSWRARNRSDDRWRDPW